jgi:hypothetical protein
MHGAAHFWKDRRLTGFGTIQCGSFLVLAVSVAGAGGATAASTENLVQSGQWRVTSTTVMNGAAMPAQMKMRCLTPEQAGDVATTFGPVSNTINSACERKGFEAAGRTLKWRLQCRGQLDVDVAGSFNFDSPLHYTAAIITTGRMAGSPISDVKTELVGEHVGECQP